jgi:enamine deaminase RidA (YjgF/YER057c/UK114 family)
MIFENSIEMQEPMMSVMSFYPVKKSFIKGQLESCLKQASDFIKNNEKSNMVPFLQTFFVNTMDHTTYQELYHMIEQERQLFFDPHLPFSVISQAPDKGMQIVMEMRMIKKAMEIDISFRSLGMNRYAVMESGTQKMIVAGGLGFATAKTNLYSQSVSAFQQMQSILQHEEMDFGDIVRQANYIERITDKESLEGAESQHYQVFNDVRTAFYNTGAFQNGYPAATGIGTHAGGVVINFVAIKGKGTEIMAVKNPLQVNAHEYSDKVLKENRLVTGLCKTTPKFERAKYCKIFDQDVLYISGTASIEKEASVNLGNVEAQTHLTILNIKTLVSKENLMGQGLPVFLCVSFIYIHVYVKKTTDMEKVAPIVKKAFPHAETLFTVADVCREELLVEIDGMAHIIRE